MYKIYRNTSYLKNLVMSLETKLDYLTALLCDLGVTESPTYLKDTELSYYLIDELKRNYYFNYSSWLTGVPHVLDTTYLSWVSETIPDEEFSKIVGYIIDFLDTRSHLKTIYDYDHKVLERKNSKINKEYLVKILKGRDNLGRPLYSVKDFTSPFNTIPYREELRVGWCDVFYKYFVRVTSENLPTNWTFFRGMTREQEYPYIKMCLEGWLQPTNTDLMDAWVSYTDHLKTSGVTVYKDLEFFIKEEQEKQIQQHSDKHILFMNDYQMGFYKLLEPNFPLYLTPVLYSPDIQFDLSNQLMGYGGEFRLEKAYPKDPAFPLKLDDGRTVKVYKRRDGSSLTYDNFNLSNFYDRLRSEGASVRDMEIVPITYDNYAKLLRATTLLERRGYKIEPNKVIE